MGSSPHLWFFAFKTATLAPELQVSMGPSPHLWICAFTTASELIVSMGPRLRLLIVNAKQRVYIQNDACLLVPAFICGLCIQNSDFSFRITSLYGSQPSFVAFAIKTATFGSELQVSMGPRLRLLIFECQRASWEPEWQLSDCPFLHLWFYAFKTETLAL